MVPPSSAPGTRGVASPPGPSSDGTDRLLPRPYRTTVEDAPDGARPWSWSGGRFDRGCGRPPRVFLPRRVGRFRQPPHAASVAVPAPAAAVRTSTALETDQRRVFTLDTRWWWTHGLPPQLVNRGGRSRGASGVARTPGPTWVGHPAGAALESAPGRVVRGRPRGSLDHTAYRRLRIPRRLNPVHGILAPYTDEQPRTPAFVVVPVHCGAHRQRSSSWNVRRRWPWHRRIHRTPALRGALPREFCRSCHAVHPEAASDLRISPLRSSTVAYRPKPREHQQYRAKKPEPTLHSVRVNPASPSLCHRRALRPRALAPTPPSPSSSRRPRSAGRHYCLQNDLERAFRHAILRHRNLPFFFWIITPHEGLAASRDNPRCTIPARHHGGSPLQHAPTSRGGRPARQPWSPPETRSSCPRLSTSRILGPGSNS